MERSAKTASCSHKLSIKIGHKDVATKVQQNITDYATGLYIRDGYSLGKQEV